MMSQGLREWGFPGWTILKRGRIKQRDVSDASPALCIPPSFDSHTFQDRLIFKLVVGSFMALCL